MARPGRRRARPAWLAAALLLLAAPTARALGGKGPAHGGGADGQQERAWTVEAVMPEHPAEAESYLCMRVDLPPERALKLVGVEPLSSQKLVHHMLLFGCESRTDAQGVWACQGHSVCPGGGNQQILYGWAKGAPPMHLPSGVGYKVGSGTKIDNLVLQIHFAVARPAGDTSGVVLHLSERHLPFHAGMLMYASYFEIPPRKETHLVAADCCYPGFEPARAVAFRVHTHALGRSVYLDEVLRNGTKRRLLEHSPQLPQGFTPVTTSLSLWPGQRLEATCAFNSSERGGATYAGATHRDEMCNLYLIHWSELPVFLSCYGGGHATIDRHGPGGVPNPAALLPEDARHWRPPQAGSGGRPALGQVAGVAKGLQGSVWVFHRGNRTWEADSFRGKRKEHFTQTEPIGDDTVLQLDQDSGEVLASWGAGAFLMPHMATVDRWGNVWLTDVALHQVFKFSPSGQLLLTLGSRLQPGAGADFCKPTHVAVANDGRVFVSDGYCNARVAEFAPDGSHAGDFALAAGDAMQVPHSLLLDECGNALVVADRETARVHRFDLDSRQPTGTWDLSKLGNVYALAAGPYGTVFALCWDVLLKSDGAARLALLHSDPGQGVEEAWLLPGVEAPHDLAIVAAPVRLAAAERPLAALVGETRPATSGASRLHKFVILPAGTKQLPTGEGAQALGSATAQWRTVLAEAEQAGGGEPLQPMSHAGHGGGHAGHDSAGGGAVGQQQEQQAAAASHALSGPDAALLSSQPPAPHRIASRLAVGSLAAAGVAGAGLALHRRWAAAKPQAA